MPKDYNDRIEETIDRVKFPEKGAEEVFISEGSPWSPEDERKVRVRMALTHLAQEIRFRAQDWYELTGTQRDVLLRCADDIEKAG